MSKFTNKEMNRPKDTLPQTKEEAVFALQVIASFKPNALVVSEKAPYIFIKRLHQPVLYFIFYIVFALLPLFILKDNYKTMYPTLILYFVFFVIFLWNLTRSSLDIAINLTRNQMIIRNTDWLGAVIRRKQSIPFESIKDFEVTFQSGKFGKEGRNIINLRTIHGRKIFLLEIKSGGASLKDGQMLAHSLKILCKDYYKELL